MLDWLDAVDQLHQVIAYLVVGILCLCAVLFGSIRERLVAGILSLDALSIVVFIGYLDGWWMVWAVTCKTVILFVLYAALSWRWPHI